MRSMRTASRRSCHSVCIPSPAHDVVGPFPRRRSPGPVTTPGVLDQTSQSPTHFDNSMTRTGYNRLLGCPHKEGSCQSGRPRQPCRPVALTRRKGVGHRHFPARPWDAASGIEQPARVGSCRLSTLGGSLFEPRVIGPPVLHFHFPLSTFHFPQFRFLAPRSRARLFPAPGILSSPVAINS
jgi:hypothetical protein